jgi:hypothetical protein
MTKKHRGTEQTLTFLKIDFYLDYIEYSCNNNNMTKNRIQNEKVGSDNRRSDGQTDRHGRLTHTHHLFTFLTWICDLFDCASIWISALYSIFTLLIKHQLVERSQQR